MKPWIRARRTRTALATCVVLALGILGGFAPRNVEGVYNAGKLIQCACDGKDYVRFHNGRVAIYSTAHEPADLLGRYEQRSDGRVDVYMTPLRAGDPEEVLFSLDRPRLAFAVATTPSDDSSCVLLRRPSWGKLKELITTQDVKDITMPDESTMISSYYDSNLSKVREERKRIENRNAPSGPGE